MTRDLKSIQRYQESVDKHLINITNNRGRKFLQKAIFNFAVDRPEIRTIGTHE